MPYRGKLGCGTVSIFRSGNVNRHVTQIRIRAGAFVGTLERAVLDHDHTGDGNFAPRACVGRSVLGVGVWLAGKNTLALMGLNANQGLANTVDRIEQHLRPAEDQARFIVRQIAKGEIDPNDRAAFGRLLTGALAGVRQIAAVSFVDTDLKSFIAAARGR